MKKFKSIGAQKLEIEEALKKMHPDNTAAFELQKKYRDLEEKEKIGNN